MEGKKIEVLFVDMQQYDSMRSSLSRKFRNYLKLIEDLGGPNFLENKFLRCSWNSDKVSGVFCLEDRKQRSNARNKTYTVTEL